MEELCAHFSPLPSHYCEESFSISQPFKDLCGSRDFGPYFCYNCAVSRVCVGPSSSTLTSKHRTWPTLGPQLGCVGACKLWGPVSYGASLWEEAERETPKPDMSLYSLPFSSQGTIMKVTPIPAITSTASASWHCVSTRSGSMTVWWASSCMLLNMTTMPARDTSLWVSGQT